MSSLLPYQRQALEQILTTMRPRMRTTASPSLATQILRKATRPDLENPVVTVTIRPTRRLVAAGVIRKGMLVKGSQSPEMGTR